MMSYTEFLIEDIKKAHRSASVDADKAMPSSFEMEMEAVENWVAGTDPPSSLAQHTGLSIEQFPADVFMEYAGRFSIKFTTRNSLSLNDWVA